MTNEKFQEIVKFMSMVEAKDIRREEEVEKVIAPQMVEEIVEEVTEEEEVILPFNCIPMHIVYGKRA